MLGTVPPFPFTVTTAKRAQATTTSRPAANANTQSSKNTYPTNSQQLTTANGAAAAPAPSAVSASMHLAIDALVFEVCKLSSPPLFRRHRSLKVGLLFRTQQVEKLIMLTRLAAKLDGTHLQVLRSRRKPLLSGQQLLCLRPNVRRLNTLLKPSRHPTRTRHLRRSMEMAL
mgnify:CR=1 FL=1